MSIKLNFDEALDFMEERMKYYELMGEPSDWETRVSLGKLSVWLRKTDDDLFDTLVEEEQKCGCRVTTPMSLSELKLLFDTRKKYDFYCGDLYNGI